MKYLRKIFESGELEEIVKPLINFELINDLKELSLEYFDDNLYLDYSILVYNRRRQCWEVVALGSDSHDFNIFNYGDETEDVDSRSIEQLRSIKVESYLRNWIVPVEYSFRIRAFNQHKIGEDEKNHLNKINTETLITLKSMYPEEQIEVKTK